MDPDTGVPLRVDVFGDGRRRPPAFTTAFRDFSRRHAAGRRARRFDPPPGADVRFDDVLDIADAANQYAPVLPPDTVAGLAKAPRPTGAVGVYGPGVTELHRHPAVRPRGRPAARAAAP